MIELSRMLESISNGDEELLKDYIEEAITITIIAIKPASSIIEAADISKLDDIIKKYRYVVNSKLSADVSNSNLININKHYIDSYLNTDNIGLKIKIAFKVAMAYILHLGLFSQLHKTGDAFYDNLVKNWYLRSNGTDTESILNNEMTQQESQSIINSLVDLFNSIMGNDRTVIIGSANELIKKMSDILYKKESFSIYRKNSIDLNKFFN